MVRNLGAGNCSDWNREMATINVQIKFKDQSNVGGVQSVCGQVCCSIGLHLDNCYSVARLATESNLRDDRE